MHDRTAMLCLLLAMATAAMADDESIESLASLMEGTYEVDEPGSRMTDRRTRIDAPELGEVVFYLQVNQGADLDVYRQRILVFEAAASVVYQRAYSLQDPERWVDAVADDFSGIGRDAVERTLPDSQFPK